MAHHVSGIGGPGTLLPRAVESLLAWSLAVACLTISGYHYVTGTLLRPRWKEVRTILQWKKNASGHEKTASIDNKASLPCWLPLTCHSRGELDRATPLERYQQFVRELSFVLSDTNSSSSANKKSSHASPKNDDGTLVALIRKNETLRRLASLAMRPIDRPSLLLLPEAGTVRSTVVSNTELGQQLVRIWPRLLELPPCGSAQDYAFASSLIVPCYREHGQHVRTVLQHALTNCVHPEQIQVVLVDAGHCTDIASAVTADSTATATAAVKKWGLVKIVKYHGQGGRGPTLNHGAAAADGRIYVFLHSDTKLPYQWDSSIAAVFLEHDATIDSENEIATKSRGATTTRANACAFGFGIDTTAEGLNGGPLPPGIRAIEITANLRCKLWSLPYGDQCLCVPAAVFEYLGGKPHQCFMEDYEFIALLRKRAALLHSFGVQDEELRIVPGPPVLCSPRRWQRLGTLYVTYANSKLVNRYASGQSPQAIYEQYYGQSLSAAASLPSPWEMRLVDKNVDRELGTRILVS